MEIEVDLAPFFSIFKGFSIGVLDLLFWRGGAVERARPARFARVGHHRARLLCETGRLFLVSAVKSVEFDMLFICRFANNFADRLILLFGLPLWVPCEEIAIAIGAACEDGVFEAADLCRNGRNSHVVHFALDEAARFENRREHAEVHCRAQQAAESLDAAFVF